MLFCFYFRNINTIRICLILAGMLWLGALVVRAANTHYVSLNGTNDNTGEYTT